VPHCWLRSKNPRSTDGYYCNRSFWIGSPNVIRNESAPSPRLCSRRQDAWQAVRDEAGRGLDLAKKYWDAPAELGSKVVEDDVLFKRLVWPTKATPRALLETSKYMVDGK